MLTAPSARLPVPVALAVVGLLGGIGALRRMPRIGNEEPDVAAWLNLNAGLDPVNDPSVRSKFYDNWFSGPQINYHNQGYYEFDGPCDTTFYASPTAEKADACGENMARKLATFVNLGPEDTLVDIAVGQGIQDKFFVEEFDVAKITGFNIGERQVAEANAALLGWSKKVQDRVSFHVGDAVSLPQQPGCSASKVTVLEAAMHFTTREDFFKEAYRILCPGGKLGFTDFAAKSRAKVRMPPDIRVSMPVENDYPIEAFKSKLEATGFVNVQIEDLSEDVVVWPNSLFFFQLSKGVSNFATEGVMYNRHFVNQKYIVVSATKP